MTKNILYVVGEINPLQEINAEDIHLVSTPLDAIYTMNNRQIDGIVIDSKTCGEEYLALGEFLEKEFDKPLKILDKISPSLENLF